MYSKKRKEDMTFISSNKKTRYGCNFCSKTFASTDGVSKHCRKRHIVDSDYQESYEKGKIKTFCYPIKIDKEYEDVQDNNSGMNNLLCASSLYCHEVLSFTDDKTVPKIINLKDLNQTSANYLNDNKIQMILSNLDNYVPKEVYSSDSSSSLISNQVEMDNHMKIINVISQYCNYFQYPNRDIVEEENEMNKQLQEVLIQKMINSIDYQQYLNMFKYNPIFLQNYYQLINNFGLITPNEVKVKDGKEIIEEFYQII